MCYIQRVGSEEGYEDDGGGISTMILILENFISRPLSSIMEAIFLFRCSKSNEVYFVSRKTVARSFLVETIKKVNNLKVK